VSAATALSAKDNSSSLTELKEHLVILGGAYRDYDLHFTLIGPQREAIVLANAIQTELFGPSVKAPSQLELLVLEVIAGTALVLVFDVLPLSLVGILLGGSALAAALALAFSYLTYGSLSGLLIFGPTLLAVLLFEIYDYVRHQWILRASDPNSSGRA
jgi:hypothetical protein